MQDHPHTDGRVKTGRYLYMKMTGASRLIKILLTTILLLYISYGLSKAQVIISFEPTINGQTLQGLQRIKIISSSKERLNGTLKINVRDGAGNMVVSILTPAFSIHPGANVLSPVIFRRSKINFGKSPVVAVLSQTGRFSQGNFQYCFEFDAAAVKLNGPVIPYENCYNYYIQPYTPLLLISPLNNSTICNPKPDFSWQPLFPAGSNTRYRLIAAEILQGQQAVDAVLNNLPVINKAELTNNLLLYPNDLQPLVQGHSYAWQVTAYVNHTIVQKSAVWSFTYDCDKAKTDSVFDSYTEVNPQINGNYYIADKVLKFAIRNPYKADDLHYSIVDLANQGKVIKGLPRIKIENGLNKIDLKLMNKKAFKNGHTYLMRIYNISNHRVELRFTYHE